MTERTEQDRNHELQTIDGSHLQNETGRDTFVALAHTAMFAASISFVGNVAPMTSAIFKPVLLAGWLFDVVGLLALTVSFEASRHAINARRAALYEPEPPSSELANRLNAAALWSFPVSLLCLFAFVTANVVHSDDRQAKPSISNLTGYCDGRSKPTP